MNDNGEEFKTGKDALKQITDRVQEELNLSSTPGACIALFINGKPMLNAGVGFWDLEKRIILNENAQFYIYSVTKTLIAAVILQLVAEGSVGLDTPVQKYLPQLPIKIPVTI